MKIETTIEQLRAALSQARKSGKSIGFVPTMGNLHDGHLQLVKQAKNRCDVVVVSIFVNPIQFGVGEDFESYPRTLDADSLLLADAGCHILFAPTVQEMYGDKPRHTTVQVSGITEILCGKSRVGHFDGVATVVSKLFNIVQPDMAFFGEKDWQQLAVIRQMTNDLNLPIDIVGVPIVRADDGLALSSRNGYLSESERQLAPSIYQVLQQSAQALQQGENLSQVLQQARQNLTEKGFVVDYIEAYTPDLQTVTEFEQDVVLFVAAKLGKTRLIDNLLVNKVLS
ncbi:MULTISPECIES: pantoate--beta-alanine ligase [unclassified Acinetobacter]|uniref:pantoate--beta-alanine ligase n=1 Tax=unclassified Acinetobacter TaxID=196816 RepID=UPI0035B85168